MTIGIIGAGNMGGAIAKGLAKASCFAQKDITVCDPQTAVLAAVSQDYPEIKTSNDNLLAAQADIVLVAVKPWLVQTVLNSIGDSLNAQKQILIIVAAGVDFSKIYSCLPDALSQMPCYRLIPNTAIAMQESMSLFCAKNTDEEQNELILGLFRKLGSVMMLPEELMSAGTSLTSCGTAYALRFIRASVEAAVEMGFRADQATAMVAQTVKGAAELLLHNQSNPEVEIDKVTTPGGITIKGLNAMEANGFSNAVIQGLKASR